MWWLTRGKIIWSCTECDSLSENQLFGFDIQTIYNSLLCKLQTIVLTVCTHVPKHLKFAQINNKYQSDVNKKIIFQRSELIVSKKKIIIWALSRSNWEKLQCSSYESVYLLFCLSVIYLSVSTALAHSRSHCHLDVLYITYNFYFSFITFN